MTTPHSQGIERVVKGITHQRKAASVPRGPGRVSGDSLLPSSQIEPRSYLGNAFKRLARDARERKGPPESSSSDDSSESSQASDPSDDSSNGSGGSTSSSDTEESSSSSDDQSRSPTSKTRKGKKKSKKGMGSHWKLLIKPVPLATYDGVFDYHDETKSVLKFNKFLTESLTYVKMGNVKPRDQVSIISRYLSNRVYAFYSREVSIRRHPWDLQKFFLKLYDHCFPPNFRQLQRDRLKGCKQGRRTVGDYMGELNELFMSIGSISKREQAVKYCDGLNPKIYAQLLVENLHAETTSLKRLHRRAQALEVVIQVARGEIGIMGGHAGLLHQANQPEERRSRSPGRHERPRKQRQGRFSQRTPRHGNGNRNNGSLQQQQNRQFREYQSRDTPNGGSRRGRDYDQPNFRSKRSRLSDEEMKKLQSENKCFTCRETGHMSRQCPKRHSVKSKPASGVTKPSS
ncbi:hypothetical protein HGRIS_009056 [Hohenbuehelia grisea]|uniref:CCHC-type domain-containing protein n=1 Tax=Hohenbuehelia grisea TaxID=104357 RepID=A0ABR3J058_9AGAR